MTMRHPVEEILNFSVPATAPIRQFNEIMIVFRLSPERADASARIAIEPVCVLATTALEQASYFISLPKARHQRSRLRPVGFGRQRHARHNPILAECVVAACPPPSCRQPLHPSL